MRELIRATVRTVVVAGLIAGAWVLVVGAWLWRAVDAATTLGGRV